MNHDVKKWKDRSDRLWAFIELWIPDVSDVSQYVDGAREAWNGPEEEE